MFEDSCYLFGDTDMTFYSALEYCEGLDATLVHINTTDENLFMKTELMQKPNSPSHWIGMTDEAEERTWTYLDGVNVSFTHWGTSQPNNGRAANCAAFWASFDYMWVDEPCTSSFKAI
ncbi:perlucin-like protein [Mya arenaria]|uniref:perlucin-like protein n=1 Tax=Mya arenaria TaxID=6604 RepID=UPI0022E611BC|nr:perlucin-like protein [Mya arenaria]